MGFRGGRYLFRHKGIWPGKPKKIRTKNDSDDASLGFNCFIPQSLSCRVGKFNINESFLWFFVPGLLLVFQHSLDISFSTWHFWENFNNNLYNSPKLNIKG